MAEETGGGYERVHAQLCRRVREEVGEAERLELCGGCERVRVFSSD